MISVQELQKEIDNLLDNITDDQLVAWYEQKTKICIKSYIGEGQYFELPEPTKEKVFVPHPICTEVINNSETFEVGDYKYGTAA